MADKTQKSPFPTMGDHGIPDSFINMSGQRSPYTAKTTVPKPGGKGPADVGSKGTKGSMLIHEANGPALHPVAKIVAPNAPQASSAPRNVRLVRSAMGNRDFWDSRATAGGTEGV